MAGSATVRQASVADLDAMVSLAVQAQADPERWCAYLGDEADSIRADVAEIDDWPEWTVVGADTAGGVVGWLLAELDPEMGRVWWWGPFCVAEDWATVADTLYAAIAPRVRDVAPEEELCGDDSSAMVAAFAARSGLLADPGSVLLNRTDRNARTDGRVRAIERADHAAVMALHDLAFPGTHTTAAALVAADKPRFVIEVDGEVLGYVACEIHSDNSGYIDYLAVHPASRGSGLGGALVDHACHDLFGRGVTHAHLTVREANESARALYKRVGFIEERIAIPYRRGFSLP